jgi:hypothetical protein
MSLYKIDHYCPARMTVIASALSIAAR